MRWLRMTPLKPGNIVYCKYKDHVAFFRSEPNTIAPQIRECVGWLVHETSDYVVVSLDRDAGPPTLKGGDGKADGRVILRREILELGMLDSPRATSSSKSPASSKVESLR